MLTVSSLYVTNIPSSKINKNDIRTALYMLFSAYGSVLDIVALKTMSMRGQAHVVFRDVQTATQAMRSLDGQTFLGMQMVRPSIIHAYDGRTTLIDRVEDSVRQVKVPLRGQARRNVPDPQHEYRGCDRGADRATAEHIQRTGARLRSRCRPRTSCEAVNHY